MGTPKTSGRGPDGRFRAGEWPACRTMGTQPVGRFDIDGGGEVWIVFLYFPVLSYGLQEGLQPRFFAGQTVDDLLTSANRALGHNRHDDGSIVFHDLRVTVTRDQGTANDVGKI